MFKSYFNFFSFFFFFFCLTYEEPTSLDQWIFPYRLYGQLFFLVVLAKYIFKIGFSNTLNFLFKKQYTAYIILIFIPTLFSFFLPVINSDGLRTSVLSLILFLFPILFLKNNSQHKFFSLLINYSNVVLIMSIIAFLRNLFDLSFLGLNLSKIEFGRLTGWMHSPNYFATFVGLAFLIEQYKISNTKKISLFSYVKLVAFGLAILFSGSRGAMVSIIVIIIINEYNNFRITGVKSAIKRIVVMISFVVVGFFFSNDNLTSQFNENITREDTEILDDPRVEIWTTSLMSWSDSGLSSKFFGSGLLSSMEIAGRSTHNSYLSAMFDFGLFYLIYLLIYILFLLRKSWYYSKKNSLFTLIFTLILFIIIRSFSNNTLGGTSFSQLIFNFCLIIILNRNTHKNNLYN
jgi:hypothetical protein